MDSLHLGNTCCDHCTWSQVMTEDCVWKQQCDSDIVQASHSSFPPTSLFLFLLPLQALLCPFVSSSEGGKKSLQTNMWWISVLNGRQQNTHSDFSQFTPLPCWVTFTQPTSSLLCFFFYSHCFNYSKQHKTLRLIHLVMFVHLPSFPPNQLRWRHIKRQIEGLLICMETHQSLKCDGFQSG